MGIDANSESSPRVIIDTIAWKGPTPEWMHLFCASICGIVIVSAGVIAIWKIP